MIVAEYIIVYSQFPREMGVLHQEGPHGEAAGLVRTRAGRSLYCGFCGKVRHGKHLMKHMSLLWSAWLVRIISVGSGAQGLAVGVGYLELR